MDIIKTALKTLNNYKYRNRIDWQFDGKLAYPKGVKDIVNSTTTLEYHVTRKKSFNLLLSAIEIKNRETYYLSKTQLLKQASRIKCEKKVVFYPARLIDEFIFDIVDVLNRNKHRSRDNWNCCEYAIGDNTFYFSIGINREIETEELTLFEGWHIAKQYQKEDL